MTSTLRKIIVLSALDHHSTMCVQDFSNKRKKETKRKRKKRQEKVLSVVLSLTYFWQRHVHTCRYVFNNKIHTNPPEYDQQSKAAGSKPAAGMPGQRRSPAQQF